MSLLLGIDFGTSYFKVGLYSQSGNLRGLGRVAIEPSSPWPDRFELGIDAFWACIREGLNQALAQAGSEPDEIRAVSYSSQANTFAVLDAGDRPLTPLILWHDKRAYRLAKEATQWARAADFRHHTGCAGLVPELMPLKWRWLRQNRPEVVKRAARILTLSDLFIYVMTGEPVGDAGTAAFTGLYLPQTNSWWPEALAEFGLSAAQLSLPKPPGSLAGRTGAAARRLLGVPEGLPLAVGGLDHQVAALGCGVGTLTPITLSMGTVLAALRIVDAVEPVAGCYHGPHADGRRFFRLAFGTPGATELEEYRRRQAPHLDVGQLIRLAEHSTEGGGRLANEELAHGWQARAIMDRICNRLGDLIEQLHVGAMPGPVVLAGGGSRSRYWRQLTADRLNLPVTTTETEEQACTGAAMLAALVAGTGGSLGEVTQRWVRMGPVCLPR